VVDQLILSLQIDDLEEKLSRAIACRSTDLQEERLAAFAVRRILSIYSKMLTPSQDELQPLSAHKSAVLQ
jgi:hypothetical protein